jgi:hypothetical protein
LHRQARVLRGAIRRPAYQPATRGIRFEQGRWWVIDLASRNGTRLDGRLVERAPLPPICTVQLYDAAPAVSLELGGPSAAAITVATSPGASPVE